MPHERRREPLLRVLPVHEVGGAIADEAARHRMGGIPSEMNEPSVLDRGDQPASVRAVAITDGAALLDGHAVILAGARRIRPADRGGEPNPDRNEMGEQRVSKGKLIGEGSSRLPAAIVQESNRDVFLVCIRSESMLILVRDERIST